MNKTKSDNEDNLFITKDTREFLFGYKNLYEKKRQIGYTNVTIDFQDEFSSLNQGQIIDPYMQISIGGGSAFKNAGELLGLENAQVVNIDAYLYNVNDDGDNAIKAYIKIPASDFTKYSKNTIKWKELDGEDLNDVDKTIGDLYSAGVLNTNYVRNLNDDKDAPVLSGDVYRNSEGFIMTENHVYVPVLIRDNEGMYRMDQKAIEKKYLGTKITEANNTESDIPSESNSSSGDETSNDNETD